MSGDYFYEFGKMSKRRCFSRLGTSRAQSQLGEPQSQLGGLWIQLGGQLGEPFKEAGRASKEAGRASGPAGRALESAGRAMEPAGRALEPVKGSQGGMDGRTEKTEKISLCGDAIGHCPLRGRCPMAP